MTTKLLRSHHPGSPDYNHSRSGATHTAAPSGFRPHGERCFYYFPGTQVATSDAASFAQQPYAVDAIMCGDHVVWINRDMSGQQLPLAGVPTPPAPERAQR